MSPRSRYSVQPLSQDNHPTYEMLLEQQALSFNPANAETPLATKTTQDKPLLGSLCYEDEHPCGLSVATVTDDLITGQRVLRLDILFLLSGVADSALAAQALLGQAYRIAAAEKCALLQWSLLQADTALIAVCDQIQATRQALYRYEVEINP